MTKHLFILTLVFGLAFLQTFTAKAAEGTFTNIHQQYLSLRAAGMGGAFAAVANDEGAIFYNPAAFARFTEGKMQAALIDAQLSATYLNFSDSVSKSFGGGAANVANIAAGLSRFYGEQYSARIKLFEMSWIRPGWGIAFIPADVSMDFGIHNQGAPSLDVRLYADTTMAYSYGHHFANESLGLLSWGVTTKLIAREYMNKEFNVLDLAASSNLVSNSDIYDGITADVDLGLLYNPYLPDGEGWNWLRKMRPTFALVGRNLLDSGFSARVMKISTVQTGQPEKLYRVFDFGTRLEIPQFWIFGGRFAFDVRDMMHPNFNLNKGLHAGFEFDWRVTSWWKGQWRAGYGQGFYSLGFSALFAAFRLDLASFGEDIGSTSTPKENRIYQVKMSSEF